jgi:hypothetical protein
VSAGSAKRNAPRLIRFFKPIAASFQANSDVHNFIIYSRHKYDSPRFDRLHYSVFNERNHFFETLMKPAAAAGSPSAC